MQTSMYYHSICKTLFNPHTSGVIVLPRVLDVHHIKGLLQELKEHSGNFVQRPVYYGTTQQELSSWDFTRSYMREHPALHELDTTHEILRHRLYEHIGLYTPVDETIVNSTLYHAGSIGIGPHRDNSFNVNFVSIYVISGTNTFFVAKNKMREGERGFTVNPGDCVLMRAPRRPYEVSLRPVHYVKHVPEDRYTIVYREINHEARNKIGWHRQYNA
jgi:hypothetical protein